MVTRMPDGTGLMRNSQFHEKALVKIAADGWPDGRREGRDKADIGERTIEHLDGGKTVKAAANTDGIIPPPIKPCRPR